MSIYLLEIPPHLKASLAREHGHNGSITSREKKGDSHQNGDEGNPDRKVKLLGGRYHRRQGSQKKGRKKKETNLVVRKESSIRR